MRLFLLACLVPLAAIPLDVAAQERRQLPPAGAVDAAEAIAAVRKAIRENYVVKDRRAALDAALAQGLARGRYRGLDPLAFAARVSEDMAAVAHDKHLGLRLDPPFAAEIARSKGEDATETAHWRALGRLQNEGVRELRVLEGNVRLLRYDGFFWNGEASRSAIDNAVAFLRGGDAIVIDLRNNGGGSPDAVRRLVSYFVPPQAKLITFHMRDAAPTTTHAEADLPGGRVAGVPVYVLISGRTASAAEEFSAHVAGFGFATLVGDTTAGAAYRNDFVAIPGGFVLSVSVGRPELPGGGDWEGKGVAPGIAVPEARALDGAMQDALTKVAAKAQGPRRTELEWAAARYGAQASGATPALPATAYAGRYGERSVTLENGSLVYQRTGGPKAAMIALGGDLFALEVDPRARLRFTASNGAITGLVIERSDGTRTDAPRG